MPKLTTYTNVGTSFADVLWQAVHEERVHAICRRSVSGLGFSLNAGLFFIPNSRWFTEPELEEPDIPLTAFSTFRHGTQLGRWREIEIRRRTDGELDFGAQLLGSCLNPLKRSDCVTGQEGSRTTAGRNGDSSIATDDCNLLDAFLNR